MQFRKGPPELIGDEVLKKEEWNNRKLSFYLLFSPELAEGHLLAHQRFISRYMEV
jgi:hypothetical protein